MGRWTSCTLRIHRLRNLFQIWFFTSHTSHWRHGLGWFLFGVLAKICSSYCSARRCPVSGPDKSGALREDMSQRCSSHRSTDSPESGCSGTVGSLLLVVCPTLIRTLSQVLAVVPELSEWCPTGGAVVVGGEVQTIIRLML